MSRKDEAIVRDLLPDEKAIKEYFAAKGKPVPHWATNALVRYWNGLPEERLPILFVRALRPQLERLPEAKDLEFLFTRLVAYCEHLDYLPLKSNGHTEQSSRAAKAYVALANTYKQLERKYGFTSTFDLTEPVTELEPWEKLPPTK